MKSTAAMLVVLLVLAVGQAAAEDAYYEVRLADLKLTEGQLPDEPAAWEGEVPQSRGYAILDGQGEAYVRYPQGWVAWRDPVANLALSICAPAGQDVTGRLCLQRQRAEVVALLHFVVPASGANAQAKDAFLSAKEQYYTNLLNRGIPGAAWFRHQLRMTQRERGAAPALPATPGRGFPPARGGDIEDTYDVLTGGKAVSENLQLDRVLLPGAPAEETVDVTTLPGITVQEMDWAPLLKDLPVTKDALAELLPGDQHALLFPSFDAFMATLDEAKAQGTPVLRLLEPRSEESRVQERYERQLCLSANLLSRLLGPQLINAVAITGSDPFMPMGTDVALLYEAKDVTALRQLIEARVTAGSAAVPGVEQVRGEVASTAYTGVRSPNRAVCSYVAAIGKAVVVTNSLVQLERIANASQGKVPSLSSLPEYSFFRGRYPRGDAAETALFIVPDAAIRRWCGPQWRIADSRRTRAAALMAEIQAEHADELVKGTLKPGPLGADSPQGLGQVSMTPDGVSSSIYGNLEFLTPVSELVPAKVTAAEASAYTSWRARYQSNWRQYFDPIAVRLSITPDRLSADLTVMPLIAGTDYADLIALTRGVAIGEKAGDPHQGALLHYAMALNPESKPVRDLSGMTTSWGANLGLQPLAWMGQTVAIYADESPFWGELKNAQNKDSFLQENWQRLPVALVAEVKDPLKLAAFLASLRGFVESSSPGLTVWETLPYAEQPYVKVHPSASAPAQQQKSAVYYAALPDMLILTVNEDVLRAALDRHAARVKGDPVPGADKAWLGSSMCLRADAKALTFLRDLADRDFRSTMRQRSWDNIPILNEWKRLYPDRDPVEVHQLLWKTRLVCPGGGTYQWSQADRTVVSTVYGDPAAPKEGPGWPAAVLRLLSGEFGVTFEHQGLRARAVLSRNPPAS